MLFRSVAPAWRSGEGSQSFFARRRGEKGHVMARGIGTVFREGTGLDDPRQVGDRAQDYRGSVAEILLELPLNGGSERGCTSSGRSEQDVPGLDVRGDIGVAQREEGLGEVGHGDAAMASDIDASEQGDVVRHGCSIIGTMNDPGGIGCRRREPRRHASGRLKPLWGGGDPA